MDIRKYITDRNKDFYDLVKSKYKIHAYRNSELCWASNFEDGIANIYYAKTKWEEASLTHELLHGYIQILGYKRIRGGISLDSTFNKNLKSLVRCFDNEFQHLKMYPIFNEKGFEKHEFYNDGDSSIEKHLANILSNENNDFIDLIPHYFSVNAPGGTMDISTIEKFKGQFHYYKSGNFRKQFEMVDSIIRDWVIDPSYDCEEYYKTLFTLISDKPIWIGYSEVFPSQGFFINKNFTAEEVNSIFPGTFTTKS